MICPACKGKGRIPTFGSIFKLDNLDRHGLKIPTDNEVCPNCHGKGYVL